VDYTVQVEGITFFHIPQRSSFSANERINFSSSFNAKYGFLQAGIVVEEAVSAGTKLLVQEFEGEKETITVIRDCGTIEETQVVKGFRDIVLDTKTRTFSFDTQPYEFETVLSDVFFVPVEYISEVVTTAVTESETAFGEEEEDVNPPAGVVLTIIPIAVALGVSVASKKRE
jgi:hypothetical protein